MRVSNLASAEECSLLSICCSAAGPGMYDFGFGSGSMDRLSAFVLFELYAAARQWVSRALEVSSKQVAQHRQCRNHGCRRYSDAFIALVDVGQVADMSCQFEY